MEVFLHYFIIQSLADFYDTRRNADKVNESTTFLEQSGKYPDPD